MDGNLAIRSRFFQSPEGSYFLFGPRGTGKSTYLKTQHPHATLIDLLLPDTHRAFLARPERLIDVIAAQIGEPTVVIDEIQRAPDLLPVIHHEIEEDRTVRFILTGSSARKLRRGGTDLLAGRLLVRAMHPYLAAELGGDFSLGHALAIGMVPLVVESSTPADTLAGYVTLYLREEVQAEGLVRNIGGFSRFLETMSFSHASVLNLSAVARECEVGRKTVEGYVSILEDLLLGFTIPVFRRRAKRTLSSHPKFYFFDAGVFRSLRPVGPLDRPEEAEGAALEGLVAQHLRGWMDYRPTANTLHFWRTKAGLEVDFVMYGEDGLWALEVKNSRRVHRGDLRGLLAFGDDYPEARLVFLYRGAEKLRIEGVECLPCEEFLKSLRPNAATLHGLTNRPG